MRRPLCVTNFICIILMLIIIRFVGIPDVNDVIPIGDTLLVTGQVQEKVYKNDKWQVFIKNATVEYKGETILEKVGVIVYPDDEDLDIKLGQWVAYEGKADVFKVATNPGEFDLKKYYASIGMHFCLYDASHKASSNSYSHIKETLYRIRCMLSYNYECMLSEEYSTAINAMLLGEKADLDKDLKKLYQDSGISHILAISGLHITMIGTCIFSILGLFRVPSKIRILLSMLFMYFYGLMTMMSISTKRALIMFGFVLGALALTRTVDMLTAFLESAVIVIASNPYVFYNSAFYLSFMAMAGIAMFSKSLLLEKKGPGTKIVNKIIPAVAVSVFLLPIILYNFYEYPIYSIILNLLLIPLMSIVIILGLVAGIVGLFSLKLGSVILLPCRFILEIYEHACKICEMLPFSKIVIGKPSMLRIMIYYFLMLLIYVIYYIRKYYLKNKYRQMDCLKYILCFVAIIIIIPVNIGLKITFIDVGQGDGICIKYWDKVIMLDGGSTSNTKLYDYQLLPFLKSQGISYIDCWCISHGDEDHSSGIMSVLEKKMLGECDISIGCIVLPDASNIQRDAKDIFEMAKLLDIPVVTISRGEEICYGKMTLTCLNPRRNDMSEDPNEYSEVFLLNYKRFSMLLTADAPLEREKDYIKYLLDNDYSRDIDILKAGHHGSSTSTSEELISQLTFNDAIIMAGKNNRYGHPHIEVINRLQDADIRIYNTQTCGAITVHTYGGKYRITTFL